MRKWVLASLVLLLCGCSSDPAKRIVGTWSSGRQGQLLDVSPNGMYAEIWLDSQVDLSTWEIEDGELLLHPFSANLPEDPRHTEFHFVTEGLEFPQEEEGRNLRFIREKEEAAPIPELVGLWSRETKTYRKEFVEFTPWSTVMWTRWQGEAGRQTLFTGWSSYAADSGRDLVFYGTMEGGDLLRWSKKVKFEATAATLTLDMPKPLGKREYVRSSRDELIKAAKQL